MSEYHDLIKIAVNGDNITPDDNLTMCEYITSWPEDLFVFHFEIIVLTFYSLTDVKDHSQIYIFSYLSVWLRFCLQKHFFSARIRHLFEKAKALN